jgi:hypothetical protein
MMQTQPLTAFSYQHHNIEEPAFLIGVGFPNP